MNRLLSFKHTLTLLLAITILVAALGIPSPAAAQSAAAQSTCGATYVVQRGDTLLKISRACGVSYTDLLKANPNIKNPSLIYAGQVINIPGGVPVTGGKPADYTVQAGETLFSIGQRYGLSVAELRLANPGLGNTINAGQVLHIPARISFGAGGTAASVQGQLGANGLHYYLVNAASGQTLEVTVSGPADLKFGLLGADGTTVKTSDTTLGFRGVLPKTQDYVLVLTSANRTSDYGVSLAIPARIQFAAGGTSASRTGTVPANLSQFFILRAGKGQTLNVTATPADKLQLSVYGVDGSVLKSGMGEGPSFSGTLPTDQDYILVLRSGAQAQSFTLNVSIPATAPVPVTGSYTVVRGDTLYSIAIKFNTTVAVLQRANPEITNPNSLAVGQVVYLPGATVTLPSGAKVYIANRGDSMNSIARKFNTTLDALVKANTQISNINLIYTGQRINLP